MPKNFTTYEYVKIHPDLCSIIIAGALPVMAQKRHVHPHETIRARENLCAMCASGASRRFERTAPPETARD
jgi:hypothetical protein